MVKFYSLIFIVAFFSFVACEEVEKKEEDKKEEHLQGEDIKVEDDITKEEGVYVLTDSNFADFIGSKESVIVEFYAPWCSHCKKLAPEYALAAEDLKDEGNIALAKVDATVQTEVAKKYDVSGYPTLIIFKNGAQIEFDGAWSREGIVSKMREISDPTWTPPVDVTVNLDDDNFTSFVNEQDVTVVMFYAPWCGHCKKLKPEYEKAAKELKEKDPPLYIAQVDATVATKIATRFEIKGYPTLKVFRKGREFEFKSEARDKWELVSYIGSLREPSSNLFKTTQALKKLIASGDVPTIPVAFFDKQDHPLANVYLDMTNELHGELPFHHTFDPALSKAFKIPSNSFVLFTSERFSHRHQPAHLHKTIDDNTVTQDLKDFLTKHRLPLISEYTTEEADKVFKDVRPLVLFFYTVDWSFEHREATKMWLVKFSEVAIKHPTIKFAIADEEGNQALIKEFGFDDSSEELNIGILGAGDRKFPMPEMDEYDQEEIEDFIKRFNLGKLKPRIKSQPKVNKANRQSDPVVTVVGNDFEEVVLDQDKDVLIEFYAPWCGHCKTLAPLYKKLAAKLKSEKRLIIAKIDATANDAPLNYPASGFPTIYFAPSGKKDEPIKYEGERNVEEIEKFMRKHAVVAFKSDKQEL